MVASDDSFSTAMFSDYEMNVIVCAGWLGWGIGPLLVLDYLRWDIWGFFSGITIVNL